MSEWTFLQCMIFVGDGWMFFSHRDVIEPCQADPGFEMCWVERCSAT